jgi:ribonucleotide reductase beta subunit family protein with ferritin-like domain
METFMKRVINGKDALNLAPIKYKYAYEFFLNTGKNFWIPQEIAVGEDINSFKYGLNDAERHVFTHVFATLSTMDKLAGNILNELSTKITSPEHQLGIAAQIYQEAYHSDSYLYCLTPDHEVLTEHGWKVIGDITTTDKVLCYDPDTSSSSFHTPSKVHNYLYTGDLNYFEGRYFKQVTTDDHRMLCIGARSRKKKVKLAKEFPVNSKVNFTLLNQAPLQSVGVGLTNHQRLLIALQADGTVYYNKWHFTLSKQRKIKRLLTLCASLGYTVTTSPTTRQNIPNQKNCTIFRVSVPKGVVATKSFSDWVEYNQSTQYYTDFMDELQHWDSHIRVDGRPSFVYCSTNSTNADIALTIGVLAGKRVSRNVQIGKGTRKDSYRITFVNADTAKGTVVKTTKKVFKQQVHCLTVPTGFFVVKADNKVSITGNCATHIGLDEEWLWSRWEQVPEIKAKIDFMTDSLKSQTFLGQYFTVAAVLESVFFMTGFNPIFALARNNKVKRVTEVLQYIARDEDLHIKFGMETIKNIIKEENLKKDLITKHFSKILNEALRLEYDYINFIYSEGSTMGYNPLEHMQYASLRARNAMRYCGLSEKHLILPEAPKSPTWIHEMLLSKKEKNFFEAKVTEYQSGGLDWSNPDVDPWTLEIKG